jgi:tetratricopeptide (TPR) repeat protein
VKLMVTSREALNLQEEWLYPISGLATPPAVIEGLPEGDSRGASERDWAAYGAVRLFIECARRVRPNFRVAQEMEGVVRSCQLVEGMPLALELAAAWTQSLDTMTIAGEIQRNLNFLTTSLRNIPERHRSIQAVLAQTWSMLSEEERRVFQQLAVFRGGFRLSAAGQVVGATLPLLSALVSKSLVRWEASSRYQELAEALEQAIQCLRRAMPSPQAAEALAAVLTDQGWNYIRLGRLEGAEMLFTEGQELLKRSGLTPPPAFSSDPAMGLSLLAQVCGDYVHARLLSRPAGAARHAGTTATCQSASMYWPMPPLHRAIMRQPGSMPSGRII